MRGREPTPAIDMALRNSRLGRQAVALGAVIAGGLGAGAPAIAEAPGPAKHPTPPHMVPEGPEPYASPLSAAKTTTPRYISKIFHKDVVYIPSIGCSGSFIRNEEKVAVAVRTARHCLKRSIATQDWRAAPTNPGEFTVYKPDYPRRVQTGDTIETRKTVAKINRFIVDDMADPSRDGALGVLENHTPQAALDSLKQMPAHEVESLRANSELHGSGWPGYQQNEIKPVTQRQEFVFTVIGPTTVDTVGGQTSMKVLATVSPKTADNASCNRGSSGMTAAKRTPGGNLLKVGVFSAYMKLNRKSTSASYQRRYARRAAWAKSRGVDLIDYDGGNMCFLSYEPLSPKANLLPADFLPSLGVVNEIPPAKPPVEIGEPPRPEHPSELTLADAKTEFNDPKREKLVINGTAVFGEKGRPAEYANDPYFHFDGGRDAAVLAYCTSESNGKPHFVYFSSLKGIKFFADEDNDPTRLQTITGPVSFSPDETGETEGACTTEQGQEFGKKFVTPPADVNKGTLYTLYNENGTPKVVAEQTKP